MVLGPGCAAIFKWVRAVIPARFGRHHATHVLQIAIPYASSSAGYVQISLSVG
jgi:hypothetical protein